MAFGYDSSSWFDAGTRPLTAGPGGLVRLGQLQAPLDQPGGPDGVVDSDGYPISVGPDDWQYVNALGSLDNYSRLSRLLSSGRPPTSADAGTWTQASTEVPRLTAPHPTIAIGAQPVTGINPTDLSSLSAFAAPEITSPFGSDGSPPDPAVAVHAPHPGVTAMGAQPMASVPAVDPSTLVTPALPQLADPFGSRLDNQSYDTSASIDPPSGLQPPPPVATVMGAQPVTPVRPANGVALADPVGGLSVNPAYWAQPGDSAWRIASHAYGRHDLSAGFEALVRSNRLRLDVDGAPVVLRGQLLSLPDISSLDSRTRAELGRAGHARITLIAQQTAARRAFEEQQQAAPPWADQSPVANLASPLPPAGMDRLGVMSTQFPPGGSVVHAPYATPPLTLHSVLSGADADFARGQRDADARYYSDVHPATILQAGLEGLDPGGILHDLNILNLATEPAGDYLGGLTRPIIPGHDPLSQALRDFIGVNLVNLPGLASGGIGEVADDAPRINLPSLASDGSGEVADASPQWRTVASYGGNLPKEGIYQIDGEIPYVGQSGQLSRRIAHWMREGRATPENVRILEVPGGKTAREIAEHQRIQELTGGRAARNSSAVHNMRDPIGARRRPGLGIQEPLR